jgi:predicted transcriptional regulator
MTDEIRAAVVARLTERGLNRTELAHISGKTPQAISRALHGGKDGGGQVPGIWLSILDALDLELVVQPKARS